MRIIGGNFKGRKILGPIDKSTRPLKDLVRESIFNILEHSKDQFINLDKANVLDLFSGTGSFGIECLSRGAKKVIFFENYYKSIRILNENIKKFNLQKKTIIFEKNAYDLNKLNFQNKKFDLIFLDPPFKDKNIYLLVAEIKKSKIVKNETMFIIHRNKKFKENFPKYLKILKEKNYGLSKIIFFK